MLLPDDQPLLAEAGKKVEFEEAGREIVGLQIGDEIGIRVGKREVAFADCHQRREMADRARQQVELRRCPSRPGLQQKRPPPRAWRQWLGRLAGAHADAEVIQRGFGSGIGAAFIDADPAMIDTPA